MAERRSAKRDMTTWVGKHLAYALRRLDLPGHEDGLFPPRSLHLSMHSCIFWSVTCSTLAWHAVAVGWVVSHTRSRASMKHHFPARTAGRAGAPSCPRCRRGAAWTTSWCCKCSRTTTPIGTACRASKWCLNTHTHLLQLCLLSIDHPSSIPRHSNIALCVPIAPMNLMAAIVAFPPFLTACCWLAPVSQLVGTDNKIGYIREHPQDATPVVVLPPVPDQAPAAAAGACEQQHPAFPPEPPAAPEPQAASSSEALHHQMPI